MGEDAGLQLGIGAFERSRNRITLNELGDFRTDHVRAQKLSGARVEDSLDETLGFAERDSLAIADEGKLADLHLSAALSCLRFSETDARDLGPAIGAAGHLRRIERVHAFHAGDAFGNN